MLVKYQFKEVNLVVNSIQKNIYLLYSVVTYIDQTFKNDNIEDQLLPNMS